MFNKSFLVALLSLSAIANAAPKKESKPSVATCDAPKTVTATATVTVTAGAAITNVAGSVSNNNGSKGSSSNNSGKNNNSSSNNNNGKGSSNNSGNNSGNAASNNNNGKGTSSNNNNGQSSNNNNTGKNTGSNNNNNAGSANNNNGKGTAATSSAAAAASISAAATGSAQNNAGSSGGAVLVDTGKGANGGNAGAATGAAAAGAAAGAANNAGNNGAATATGDAQESLTLDPAVLATSFFLDGLANATPGQVASLTSRNNFINFCKAHPDKPITNGQQIKTGSCNPAPMGIIAAQTNMPSTKFQFPLNFGNIEPNKAFNVVLKVAHIQLGNFVNAQASYFAGPQTVNAAGDIIGHTHVVIEAIDSLASTQLTDPTKFAFFKGVDQAQDASGSVTVPVAAGLPEGFYKMTTIQSSSNHAPVAVAVAQHGSTEDTVYFTVGKGGADALGEDAAAQAAASSLAAAKGAPTASSANDAGAAGAAVTATAALATGTAAAGAAGAAATSVAVAGSSAAVAGAAGAAATSVAVAGSSVAAAAGASSVAIAASSVAAGAAATSVAAASSVAAAGAAAATGAAQAGAATGSLALQNGKAAIAANKLFATTKDGDACTTNQPMCAGDKLATCVNGKVVSSAACGGQVCRSLPLANQAGAVAGCTTAADAQRQIAATGATARRRRSFAVRRA
jgi:hypothetical protein